MKQADKTTELYLRALAHYGSSHQITMVVEECAELIDAIAKYQRGRVGVEAVITELADVSIVSEQLSYYFGHEQFIAEKERKLLRLQQRIEGKGS